MKKKIIFIFLFIGYVSFAQITSELNVQQNEFNFVAKDSFVLVKANNVQYMKIVGAPMLPFYSKTFLLPPNTKLTNIQVIGSNKIHFNGNYNIAPTPPLVQ